MLQQKQARVRISSHDSVIHMSEDYLPSDSRCSCPQCDSTACFKIRNLNSGIPCTCPECDPNICLAWEVKNDCEQKPSTVISKDLLNPVSKLKTSDIKNHRTGSIKSTNQSIKENISSSCSGKDVQNNNFDDPELKEVFTKEKNPVDECGTVKQLLENRDFDDFDIKETSSNEKSDIIECDSTNLENNHSNDSEHKQVSAKERVDKKKCCSKNFSHHETKQSLTSNDLKYKHIPKTEVSLRNNESNHPETKELFTRKIGKCCSLKIDNTKSDLPEVYQIFTNEKKNIIKCCNISKDLENKNSDASENKQDNQENKIKCLNRNCKESKDLQNNKTEPNLEITTIKKLTNITCNKHEHPIKDKTSDIDFGNYTRYSYKDVLHTKNKINMNKTDKSYEKYVSRLQSVAITYARPDCENSRAELSAQIMNVPYEEFKDSLSRKQSSTHSNTCNSSIKLEKMDIFTRLKEIYKACSCKVCECIAGKSLFNRNEICNCEPCDCNDCNGYMAKLQRRINSVPHSGCPCVSCDRKDCRGVVKKTQDYMACDCKPCDCVRCTESFTKPCSCTPCQCESCRTSIFMPQRLMVANAAESIRHSICDCDPCECTNCTSNYSAMTSNLMREISTGIITYGNCNCEACSNDTCQLGRSNCRCDPQQNVIRKPMAEKSSDYGIHRVNIKENKYEKTITNNNRNTITMFALSNNYPNRLFNYTNKIMTCECDVCECIVCKDKGKGYVTNKPLKNEIDKQYCNINTKSLNDCACSPCKCKPCKNCKSLHKTNHDGSVCENAEYDACNCTNSKKLGYNSEIIVDNENYNLKNNDMSKLDKCREVKNLVDLPSQNSTDTDQAFLHDIKHDDNETFYHLKKGKLLTPSIFENNGLASNSCHIHVNPEKDGLTENDLRKSFTKEQDTKLCRSKSRLNYFDNLTCKSPESAIKVISRNSSVMNMVSKEIGTTEIFKINSVDFKNGNASKIFCGHSKTNVQNDDSNLLLDEGLRLVIEKPSSHCINNILENNQDITKSSQTPFLDRKEVKDFIKTMSLSNTDVHFSSAKSMSLVKLLCQERNLNIDNRRAIKFLQSLEKIPLKRLKMDDENLAYTCVKILNDDVGLDSVVKDNYSFPIDQIISINMDQEKSETLNCENQLVVTHLTDAKIDNCDVHDKNTLNAPVSKTTTHIKSKDISNTRMVVRKPNNYNKNVRVKGSVIQSRTNKPKSKTKVTNSNLRSKTENHLNLTRDVNKVNNKRYLEMPSIVDTATSAIHFKESNRPIDFVKSFKLLNEVNYNIGENKKTSPILRKNFYFRPEIVNNGGKCSLLEFDVKNAVKSTSLQTNSFPYYPGIGYGNKALTKLQSEVDELLYSPLLQSSLINNQTEKSRSKSKLNLEFKSCMSDATSQTKRINIVVDKEINCDIYQSRENLRQSIQSLINMTLKEVMQRTDNETKKKSFLRNFNVSDINAAKSSCGGLKASFVGLRKVSDHTVLLRWATPRDLGNIQGYELQVDGRPVQKILNPSRCMAVLTCLPHSERLLLAIRTITNLNTCHNPVTTVVYNPKKK